MSRLSWRRAVLAAAVAACALPGAAQASTVELAADGTTLNYRGANGENNSLNVRMDAGALEVKDFAGLTSRTPLCASVNSATVRCGVGIRRLNAQLGDRNDGASIRVAMPVIVEGGSGNDSFVAGIGPDPSNVAYHGGSGFDTASYQSADRGVFVGTSSQGATDGRLSFDRDNVMDDVEVIRGSSFGDILSNNDQSFMTKTLDGNDGADTLHASSVSFGTVFDMGAAADGADQIIGGSGTYVSLDYSGRTQPVNATIRFGGADDGEAGERDEILADSPSTTVKGGQARDTMRAAPGSLAHHGLHGNGGTDRIEGGDSGDHLVGGPGADTLAGNGGNDAIDANDGVGEIVACGGGTDSAQLDSLDGFSSCESRRVGVLRLAPKALRAQAGEPARLRLSWRHPRAWRQLRTIELQVTHDGAPVGTIAINPRSGRMTDNGAVQLVRRASRLSRDGRTVTARLALRLDPSLAGRTLTADVEATDRRGGRQLERGAATIRVGQ
jgi:hypothetical protein